VQQLSYRQKLPFKKPLGAFYKMIYVLLIGWWLGGLWVLLGYVFCLTIVFLPLGVFMLWNSTFLLLLRYPAIYAEARTKIRISPSDSDVQFSLGIPSSPHFLWQALWFVFIGFWLSGLCCLAGYVLCILIFPRQAGIWILERIPFVMVLQRITIQLDL
jgi:uncharacterized membrane protein YccF (DUF307 family)